MTARPQSADHDGVAVVPTPRSTVRDALVVAIAGLVANGLNFIVTIVLARVLPVRHHSSAYGAFAQMVGLFIVVSLPGSAIAIAVVRRSSWWLARTGDAELEACRQGARRGQLGRGAADVARRRHLGRDRRRARVPPVVSPLSPAGGELPDRGAGSDGRGDDRRRGRRRHRCGRRHPRRRTRHLGARVVGGGARGAGTLALGGGDPAAR